MNKRQKIGILIGIAGSIIILILGENQNLKYEISATLSVAFLMAIWWVTEAVPIAVTALLPLVLFPLLGVMNGKTVSSAYVNHIIFLFIGGFLLALATEKHNLHKRIALRILRLSGQSFGRILFGFMFATAFLSMWMSNTATAMMMVPVALSVISKVSESSGEADKKKYAYGLLFGIAYSASIGGTASLIGTPPNLSFARIYAVLFPDTAEISFSQWMIFALPAAVLMLTAAWFLLFWKYKPKEINIEKNIFKDAYAKLGAISYEEKIVLTAFISVALLWIFRADINFGNYKITGWASLFKHPKYINDGTVAIGISILLFMIPEKSHENSRILEFDIISKLPWHIVLLFGGGFALAQAFADSGTAVWIGQQMDFAKNLPPLLIIFLTALLMSFLTELSSNTATTEMLLPVFAGIAVHIGVNPLLLMIPATMAASLAFMLPVATPPNAIIFGTDKLEISEMVKTGFWLNIAGVLIISLIMYYWGQIVFNIS